MIELVDYPAEASSEVQAKIAAFLEACESIRSGHTASLQRSRLALATALSRPLRARRDDLESLLRDGDRWLTSHFDPTDEAAWFAAEAEYRAIEDALRAGLVAAFGERVTPEQAQLVMGATA